MENNINLETSIIKELWHRFKKPWCFSFIWHFVWYIIIIGGFGIILSIINYCTTKNSDWSVAQNIISYSLAMTIPAASAIIKTFPKTYNKVSLIDVCAVLFIVIPIGLSLLSFYFKNTLLSILCLLIAWIAWIIANYDNVNLNDKSYYDNVNEGVKQHGTNWR